MNNTVLYLHNRSQETRSHTRKSSKLPLFASKQTALSSRRWRNDFLFPSKHLLPSSELIVTGSISPVLCVHKAIPPAQKKMRHVLLTWTFSSWAAWESSTLGSPSCRRARPARASPSGWWNRPGEKRKKYALKSGPLCFSHSFCTIFFLSPPLLFGLGKFVVP